MRDPRWELPNFDAFHGYLYTVNNGTMDVEGFIDSEYGHELTSRLEVRFSIEDNHTLAEAYYHSVGLIKEYNDWEDYYSRWTLLVPEKASKKSGKRPLVFWLHGMGNSIEAEENMTGFTKIAAKEGFYLACPQNTNYDKICAIIENVKSRYSIDEGRIYLAGFSHGAAQAEGHVFHHPEKFAALVTSGIECFRPWDNFNQEYTKEELEKYKVLRVPLLSMSGQCEPFPFAPVNTYHSRYRFRPKWGTPDTFSNIGKDRMKDPTLMHVETLDKDGKKTVRPGMAKDYEPAEGENPAVWSLQRLNQRLTLLDCEERNVEESLAMESLHDDQLRRIIGTYGDYEAVDYYYGYRHYTLGINDRTGNEMFRFVVVQNSPHWVPLAIGEIGYAFMKRYSRDLKTGKLIIKK